MRLRRGINKPQVLRCAQDDKLILSTRVCVDFEIAATAGSFGCASG
jgi:hypothetical protein